MKKSLKIFIFVVALLNSNTLYALTKERVANQNSSAGAESISENSPSHSASEIGVMQPSPSITTFGVNLVKTSFSGNSINDLVVRGGISELSKKASAGVEVMLSW